MNALNTGDWSGWYTVNGALPAGEPSGGVAATTKPPTGSYNYYVPPALSVEGEGAASVDMWTTVIPAPSPSIRTGIKLPHSRDRKSGRRRTGSRFDEEARQWPGKISLLREARTKTAVSTPRAIRRVELIALPVARSIWARALLMRNTINMSGSGVIDSFDSTNPFKSTGGLYGVAKRQSHGDVGTANSTGWICVAHTFTVPLPTAGQP